jgi:prolyl-tRNA editing enzyme YbaK/EbsC (Cys-tRNA(Pro) deacylase)
MIEQRVVQALDAIGVPYELMEIDPAFADTAVCCEKYGLPLDSAGNTIVVASKKEPRRFGACVVKATTRLDVNRAVRALLGVSKVSFATAEETKTLTGMMLGGVTVFALPADLPIYVDDKLMARDWVILGSGSRSSKIKISPDVFRRLPNATIVPGLAIETCDGPSKESVHGAHEERGHPGAVRLGNDVRAIRRLRRHAGEPQA